MKPPDSKEDKIKTLKNTLFWGFVLWLFGYLLGILFFMFVPNEAIGFYILPIGLAATVWVLFKKIEREKFFHYVIVGVFWVVLALLLDYVFIVLLLGSADYYKLDVYLYYALTLILPPVVGWYKLKKTP